jgi:hypothetical protein
MVYLSRSKMLKAMNNEPNYISNDEYNQQITNWGTKTGQDLRNSIRMLTSKGKGALLKSLRLKTAKWYGEIDKISYHFDRHGIFLHKGVGRGYRMIGGVVVRVSTPGSVILNKGKFNESKVLKAGPMGIFANSKVNRKSKEWYNPVIIKNVDKLADMIAEINADRVVNITNKITIR